MSINKKFILLGIIFIIYGAGFLTGYSAAMLQHHTVNLEKNS